MSAQYTRDHCKISIAKILQTIGWHSINSTPLEVLTDILSNYMSQIAKITNDYANEFGQTEANLDHLGLAFQEMGVNLPEIEEYVTYVNFTPAAHPVPKYPIPKENNLNFLKPGSKEVVTRPVHVNEHLPPMYPLLEEAEEETVVKKEQTQDEQGEQFKKPTGITTRVATPEFKRPRKEEEGGRPTREISSVMMTTSGFLSPAREGRLPEAKAPAPPPAETVKAPSPGPQVVEQPPPPTVVKKKAEKRKEKPVKELFRPDEKPAKKMTVGKEGFKTKQGGIHPIPVPVQQHHPHFPAVAQHSAAATKMDISKQIFSKALAAAKAKTEKLNTTITPIPIKNEPLTAFHNMPPQQVDKLFNEPDKKKINILKKISNVKEKQMRTPVPHLPDPDDIVSKINLSGDITIEPIHPIAADKADGYFDTGSPPVTPPTPRTPEIIMKQSPPLAKERRKRKDKARIKKIKKQPNFLDTAELVNMALDRPKTPDGHMLARQSTPHFPPPITFPFPLANFGGPGLIPAPLFPFAAPLPSFGKNAYFPPVPQIEAVPKLSPKSKPPIKPEPAEIVPIPPPPQPAPPPPIVPTHSPTPPVLPPTQPASSESPVPPIDDVKKLKEHKKEKKEKIKKKNKKEKGKDKTEKKRKEKDKVKKEKKKKEPKEGEIPIPKILLKVNSPSPRPETPEGIRKLNIKPVVKKEEPEPDLAKISALVTGPPKQKTPLPTPQPPEKASPEVVPAPAPSPRPPGRPRIYPLKPKQTPKPKKVEQPQPFVRKDAEGNDVWICPACGQQDDGRPMIGCDGCDAWYHWVCVGIQVPPDENENWYCKPCLCKKNEDLQDKKKKRKKKEKRDH